MSFPEELLKLSYLISQLPGVGSRLASKAAIYLALNPNNYTENLVTGIRTVIEKLSSCINCGNLSRKGERCKICSNSLRAEDQIMVVQDVSGLNTIEESGAYNGKYHVLGGVLSPSRGITPTDLNIDSLLKRLANGSLEVIFALNPDLEGEATIMFLKEKIIKLNSLITFSRLARGIPTGSDIEFLPGKTLAESIKQRTLF